MIAAITSGALGEVSAALQERPQLVGERPGGAPSLPLLAVYHGQPAIAALLVEKGAKVGIFEAAAMGLLEEARSLVASDPKLANAYAEDGFQPLGLASFFGHAPLARLLLEHGAEVNSPARNPQRVMPLHSAVAASSPEIVRLLLAHGADVNAVQQGGYAPIHQAANSGNTEILAMLLNAGARRDVEAEDGSTPLALALRAGHEKAANLLRRQSP